MAQNSLLFSQIPLTAAALRWIPDKKPFTSYQCGHLLAAQPFPFACWADGGQTQRVGTEAPLTSKDEVFKLRCLSARACVAQKGTLQTCTALLRRGWGVDASLFGRYTRTQTKLAPSIQVAVGFTVSCRASAYNFCHVVGEMQQGKQLTATRNCPRSC